MTGICNLIYAAKDKWGGSTNLQGTTPYLSRKPIKVEGPFSGLEDVTIVLNVYFDIAKCSIDKGDAVYALLYEDYPKALGKAIGEIFDYIIDSLR